MRALTCSVLAVFGVFVCVSAADPVDTLRDGEDMHFDLLGASGTASGAVNDSFLIADEDAPATCVEKDAGTLTFSVDLQAIGAPFPIVATFTGVKVSPTEVRWTTDFMPDVCVTVDVNGTPVDLLIRRVQGRLKSTVQFTNEFDDDVCVNRYNVEFEDVGGDGENFVDIEAYALCFQSTFTRVDIRMRDIDAIGFGGADCPGDTNGDGVVDFADFSTVLAQYGQSGVGLAGDLNGDGVVDFTDFSQVLANYGVAC